MNRPFSLHSGLDAYYREVSTAINVPVVADSTTELKLMFDVSKWWYISGDTVDVALPNEQYLHGGQGSAPLNEKFSNNVQGSFTVSL